MIYPKFYHCNRFGSDRKWICEMLLFIPETKQQVVCNTYDWVSTSRHESRRKIANIFLHGVAKKHRYKNDKNRT